MVDTRCAQALTLSACGPHMTELAVVLPFILDDEMKVLGSLVSLSVTRETEFLIDLWPRTIYKYSGRLGLEPLLEAWEAAYMARYGLHG